jgi:hypothetical protein
MGKEEYYLPGSYQKGRIYFYQNGNKTDVNGYYPVTFFAYRPHPAELVIEFNGTRRKVHRRYLFSLKEINSKENLSTQPDDVNQ